MNTSSFKHEWDINGFIKELIDIGVEFTLTLSEYSPTEFSFNISHRLSFEDSAKVRILLSKYFGYCSGGLVHMPL